jgi:hypothetical protein
MEAKHKYKLFDEENNNDIESIIHNLTFKSFQVLDKWLKKIGSENDYIPKIIRDKFISDLIDYSSDEPEPDDLDDYIDNYEYSYGIPLENAIRNEKEKEQKKKALDEKKEEKKIERWWDVKADTDDDTDTEEELEDSEAEEEEKKETEEDIAKREKNIMRLLEKEAQQEEDTDEDTDEEKERQEEKAFFEEFGRKDTPPPTDDDTDTDEDDNDKARAEFLKNYKEEYGEDTDEDTEDEVEEPEPEVDIDPLEDLIDSDLEDYELEREKLLEEEEEKKKKSEEVVETLMEQADKYYKNLETDDEDTDEEEEKELRIAELEFEKKKSIEKHNELFRENESLEKKVLSLEKNILSLEKEVKEKKDEIQELKQYEKKYKKRGKKLKEYEKSIGELEKSIVNKDKFNEEIIDENVNLQERLDKIEKKYNELIEKKQLPIEEKKEPEKKEKKKYAKQIRIDISPHFTELDKNILTIENPTKNQNYTIIPLTKFKAIFFSTELGFANKNSKKIDSFFVNKDINRNVEVYEDLIDSFGTYLDRDYIVKQVEEEKEKRSKRKGNSAKTKSLKELKGLLLLELIDNYNKIDSTSDKLDVKINLGDRNFKIVNQLKDMDLTKKAPKPRPTRQAVYYPKYRHTLRNNPEDIPEGGRIYRSHPRDTGADMNVRQTYKYSIKTEVEKEVKKSGEKRYDEPHRRDRMTIEFILSKLELNDKQDEYMDTIQVIKNYGSIRTIDFVFGKLYKQKKGSIAELSKRVPEGKEKAIEQYGEIPNRPYPPRYGEPERKYGIRHFAPYKIQEKEYAKHREDRERHRGK